MIFCGEAELERSFVPVDQLDRSLASEARGCRFEPCRGYSRSCGLCISTGFTQPHPISSPLAQRLITLTWSALSEGSGDSSIVGRVFVVGPGASKIRHWGTLKS